MSWPDVVGLVAYLGMVCFVAWLMLAATRAAYVNTCVEMGLDPDTVPSEFIDLAAVVSKRILLAFCEENELELPEDSLEDSLARLVEGGLITNEDVEAIKAEMAAMEAANAAGPH